MHKFWNFIRDDAGERILRLEGPIDEDDLWGDAVTPKMFRDELEAEEGDVTVWLNSPGGNVFAANEIYNMLRDHKGKITVKIDAIAASAASVVAMAGDTVLISPVGMLLIHDPMTVAMGNTKDMEKAIDTLNKVKESIIGAYQAKTGLSHNKISQLMSAESWLYAKEAKELGFVDGILFEEEEKDGEKEEEGVTVKAQWKPYQARVMACSIWDRLTGHSAEDSAGAGKEPEKPAAEEKDVEPSEAGVKDESRKPEGEGSSNDPQKEEQEEKPETPGKDTPSEEPDEGSPDKEDEPEESDPKKKTEDTAPPVPVIGMDGKTKDGAMPYELLRRELDLLR